MISAFCMFCGNIPESNPDAAAEALRAAGYQVFRLPPELKAMCEEGRDFIEIRSEGLDDDDGVWTDTQDIVEPFGGEVDSFGAASDELFVGLTELLNPRPRCAQCRAHGTPDRPLLSISVGQRHAWLHNDCQGLWLDRLVETGDALVEEGSQFETPVEVQLGAGLDRLDEEEF